MLDWTDLTVPIHVISLIRSLDRRAAITERFGRRNLPFYFSDALDGHDAEALRAAACCADHPGSVSIYTHRPLPVSDSERACTISHLRTIRAAHHAGLDRVLICEDDIDMGDLTSREFSTLLDAAPPDAAYLQFLVSGPSAVRALADQALVSSRLFFEKSSAPSIHFSDPALARVGCHAAAAYLLTRPAMEAVSALFDPQDRVVWPCRQNQLAHNVGLVADRLVYQVAASAGPGYACAFPTFILDGIDSTLHEAHVPSHRETRQAALEARARLRATHVLMRSISSENP